MFTALINLLVIALIIFVYWFFFGKKGKGGESHDH